MQRKASFDNARRFFLKQAATIGPAAAFGLSRSLFGSQAHAETLARAFTHPAETAGPGAYWYWLGGNVTREGITADLEAMRAVGISNPMLFAIGKSGPDTLVQPPADALTPVWWELLEHAVSEADRLGLTLSLNFCDGWATASGPWITPELSMQKVVWSHLTVEGGTPFDGRLPQPPVAHGYYREIATFAFPFPQQWEETSCTRKAQLSTNLPLRLADPLRLGDPNNTTEIIDTDAVDAQQTAWLQYAFEGSFTLRSVTVRTPSPPGYSPGVYRAANSLEVQASEDGVNFRRIGSLEYPKHGWQTDLTTLTHAVPQTTARYFRLVHRAIPPQPYEEDYDFGQDTRLRFFSIVLSGEPRIHHLEGKSGAQWAISRRTTRDDLPDESCVPLRQMVDLTSRVQPDGTLQWEAPPGRWRVLRIGCTTTGSQNSAAGGAQGLECDKFSEQATTLQFEKWFGLALQRVGPRLAGRVLHVLHVDSWEAGAQNWSPVFRDGFMQLRGYDLLPYIAVMTGVPIESADVSERVLLDVRRTINDLMCSGFFRTAARLAHARGCLFSAEPPNPTFPADGMQHLVNVDLPMGEFWLNTPRNDKPTDIKDAVSGAHLYGKRLVGAEAFTQGLMSWDEHPFTLKALGDHIFCQGINRFMLHVYAQQPWVDRAPGMTLNGIGTFFSRTQTWWKPGKAWFDYLRRCQALLQRGLAVADVCYFTGENIPARALLPRQLSPQLPPGYAYDSINRDAILRLADVRGGRIVLKTGASYSVLVLPDDVLMSHEVAARLLELVRAGAVIVGPRPQRTPSLEGYPDADAKLGKIAAELWGELDGVQRTERRVGKGRVAWGKPLQAVLRETGVLADVEIRAQTPMAAATASTSSVTADVEWIHRRDGNHDIYFLSNQTNIPRKLEVTFRIAHRAPELWRPDCGEMETLALWREEDGRTVVPFDLDPFGSVFIVFTLRAQPSDHFSAISGPDDAIQLRERHGRIEALVARPGRWMLQRRSGRSQLLEIRELEKPVALAAPWRVRFRDALPSPVEITLNTLADWTEQPDDTVKYYSGTAAYTADFALTPTMTAADRRVILDLGQVHDLVEVRVNEQRLGVLWKPPFSIDITRAARPGRNQLELLVTNTWRNRLIGDYGTSAQQRTTFVVPMLRKGQQWLPGGPDAVLSPAGLLGPVRVRFSAVVPV